jgi:hypothetical protein
MLMGEIETKAFELLNDMVAKGLGAGRLTVSGEPNWA